jgi:glycosyltransferase involved in cell wall biosynthesis
MPVIYKLADLFVYPSFFEGFGIPIVEALASEVSVLCSDIPCFREVGGEEVHYFDPNDSIALGELIMSELHKAKANNRVGETVKRFSSSAFAEEMISVYIG